MNLTSLFTKLKEIKLLFVVAGMVFLGLSCVFETPKQSNPSTDSGIIVTTPLVTMPIFENEENGQDIIEIVKAAVEQNDAVAQYHLGLCYRAMGLEQSDEKALYWYVKAAEQGLAEGQFCLGHCYEYGLGVEKNYENAVYWYAKASEQGLADAQCNLGYCYEAGHGVKKSYETAVYWYTKAAEQGSNSAQYNLACCYQQGLGVEQDEDLANYWFREYMQSIQIESVEFY